MPILIAFNKPYGVLSQFTDPEASRPTLADYISIPRVRPAGRLDFDSEGLLLLTSDGLLQARIAHPRYKLAKTYWVQVEGIPDSPAISKLKNGVILKDGPTRRAQVSRIEEPGTIWPRTPPIRYRASIPTTWLEITISEGRNRQVRRMTAAVGHPTLRLIRSSIGPWNLEGLEPGQWRQLQHALEPQTHWPDNITKGSRCRKSGSR